MKALAFIFLALLSFNVSAEKLKKFDCDGEPMELINDIITFKSYKGKLVSGAGTKSQVVFAFTDGKNQSHLTITRLGNTFTLKGKDYICEYLDPEEY